MQYLLPIGLHMIPSGHTKSSSPSPSPSPSLSPSPAVAVDEEKAVGTRIDTNREPTPCLRKLTTEPLAM